jgi:hypothetical protein
VPAREREVAGGRNGIVEARTLALEDGLQDPRERLGADDGEDDENRFLAGAATGEQAHRDT